MKTKLIIAFFFIMACSCSEDKTNTIPVIPVPVVAACESNLSSGLLFSGTFAYTGATYSIDGTKFCKEDLVSLLINDQEILFSEILTSKISFVIPFINGDSVSLKIKTKTSTIDLKKKIALFPGSGAWTEIPSFPGLGRIGDISTVVGTKGYLAGGQRYTGFTPPNTYNRDYYNDLYEFDLLSNTWTLVDNNDNFKLTDNAITIDNKLFVFNNLGLNIYDLATKSFGTWAIVLFSPGYL